MKNILIPLTPIDHNEYEPALKELGDPVKRLPEKYKFRADLVGMVRECGGLPLVEVFNERHCIDFLYAVSNPSKEIQELWANT